MAAFANAGNHVQMSILEVFLLELEFQPARCLAVMVECDGW